MKKQPRLSLRAAAGGARVIDIELTNRPGIYAVMDLADFRDWQAAGRSTSFYAFSNGQGREYVGFPDLSRPGHHATVARALLSPGGKKAVRYRNDDPLNLRRANLYAAVGKGSGRKAGVPQGPRSSAAVQPAEVAC